MKLVISESVPTVYIYFIDTNHVPPINYFINTFNLHLIKRRLQTMYENLQLVLGRDRYVRVGNQS